MSRNLAGPSSPGGFLCVPQQDRGHVGRRRRRGTDLMWYSLTRFQVEHPSSVLPDSLHDLIRIRDALETPVGIHVRNHRFRRQRASTPKELTLRLQRCLAGLWVELDH
jgi:hypothetical protein